MESKPIDREAVLNSLVLNNSTTDGQPRKRKRLDNLSAEERALRRFVRTIVAQRLQMFDTVVVLWRLVFRWLNAFYHFC